MKPRSDLDQLSADTAGVALADNGNPDHGPYIIFRRVCGEHGYHYSAGFRDKDDAYGVGKTPRQAMKSLAVSLRELADRVDLAAGG